METLYFFLFAVLVPLLFCTSLLDISLRSVNYHKIVSIHRHGNPKAAKLFSLLSSPERAISVLLFLRYSVAALLFLTGGALILRIDSPPLMKPFFGAILLLSALILLEYVPRMLAIHNPERMAFALLGPFELILKINRYLPVPQFCEMLASRVLRVGGLNTDKIFSQFSVNEINMFLNLNREKEESELKKQVIDSKFVDFSGRRVREVMVPRPSVKAVEIDTPFASLLQIIQENSYSRMPVFRSSFDNILGILHVKDIIGMMEPFSIARFLRKPFFIPETATVLSAFQNMRRNRAHLAIVVDEYGGVDGIVTLEDLIEELLGEIQDEYDEEVQLLQKLSESTWILEGNLAVKELNQNLNLDVPENPSYTTVAGFLLSVVDKIPSEKDQIHYGNLLFSIEKMMGNKISKVCLKLPVPLHETTPTTNHA